MWKLITLSLSCITLVSCLIEDVTNTKQEKKVTAISAKIAQETNYDITKKIAQELSSTVVDQAVKDIQKQLADLSQEEMQKIKNMAIKTADRTAENTAKQIASSATDQAISNMQQQFSKLSQEQMQKIIEIANETAGETAENTAKQIAVSTTDQAISNMQQQFSKLSQEQMLKIIEIAGETAGETAENTAKQIAVSTTDQAISDMQQQFSKLSQEQMQKIIEIANETAGETAENTAKQIAVSTTDQAISNMQQQFSKLSQEQIQKITEIANETAGETAENTAKQIAVSTTDQAISNMQQQFSKLSQEQIQKITEIATQTAGETAENTAKQIADSATDQAISDMQQQFSKLSQEQMQKIIEIAGETAGETAENTAKQIATETASETAENTAKQIAGSATDQAISNMQQQFSKLSQEQIQKINQIATETAGETAENTAKQIAVSTTDQAILNMQQQFSKLSQEQMQKIIEIAGETASETAENTAKQIASETAENTAKQIAVSTTDKAISDMQEKISRSLEANIQTIKESSLQLSDHIAENTAKQIASSTTDQAIEDLKHEFSDLSQEQMLVIKENVMKLTATIAVETAKETAKSIASAITNQAIADMQQQFSNLSQKQIQAIKQSSQEAASATAQEVTNSIVENAVKQVANPMTAQAIQDMEQKYSDLLKAGLRTIISAAIEAATTYAYNSKEDDTTKQEIINVAVNQASAYIKGPDFKLPFEKCHWTNKDLTAQIVKDHNFFHLSDPLQDMLESWNNFKTTEVKEDIEEEFSYLSPQYDDFILSFFQESLNDTHLSEGDVPLECFFASAIRGANIYSPGKNFYYCEKDSNSPGNISVIDNNEQDRDILPRRACLNKDYLYLTAKAFNKTAECFGFSKLEKEDIFKLFNHESSFLHNVKSHTGAKCYGQLTSITIKEINKQIYFSDTTYPLPYSHIFNDVIEKCPGLKQTVLNPEIYAPAKRKNMKKFDRIASRSPISCKVTQNPYSCLFYALYNIKINSVAIQRLLKRPTSNFIKRNEIPQEFKDRFSLPISLDTMLGVTKTRDMIFWDDSELWGALKNQPLDHLSNIRQLPLFRNEAEVKELFNFWTYNGGISITKKHMIRFIKQLKQSVAQACPEGSQTTTCQYRAVIQNGEGLATADIKREFQTYIRNNYGLQEQISRRREVINFANKVEKNLNYLYQKDGLFKTHLRKIVPELSKQDITSFQDHLKAVCPKP